MNWHGKPGTYYLLVNNPTSPSLHLTKNSFNLRGGLLKLQNLNASKQVPQAIYTTPLLRMAWHARKQFLSSSFERTICFIDKLFSCFLVSPRVTLAVGWRESMFQGKRERWQFSSHDTCTLFGGPLCGDPSLTWLAWLTKMEDVEQTQERSLSACF